MMFSLTLLIAKHYLSPGVERQDPINDTQREMFNSLRSFMLASVLMSFLEVSNWKFGFVEISSYNILLQTLFLVILHDGYFYWLHRLLHSRAFKKLHLTHHTQIEVSPMTAFSFSPIEALAQFAFLAFVDQVFIHNAYFPFTATIFAWNAWVHLGNPIGRKSLLSKVLIGPRFHELHHKKSGINFGLYFTFWDRVMGTNEVNS